MTTRDIQNLKEYGKTVFGVVMALIATALFAFLGRSDGLPTLVMLPVTFFTTFIAARNGYVFLGRGNLKRAHLVYGLSAIGLFAIAVLFSYSFMNMTGYWAGVQTMYLVTLIFYIACLSRREEG